MILVNTLERIGELVVRPNRLDRRRRQCAGGDRIFAAIRSTPIASHPCTARGIENRAWQSRNLPRNHH
jgi:hypothetical protein